MRIVTATTADGVPLHLVEWRDAGAPVLLLHGFGNNGRIWEPFAAQLPPSLRCLALDHRGHGDSGRAADYSRPGFLRDVEAVAASIGEPFGLVGHSMGGQLAVHFAAARPDLVRALVVVDTGPRVERAGAQRVRHDLAAMRDRYASIDEHAAELRRSYLLATNDAVRRLAASNLTRSERGGYTLKLDPALRRPPPPEAAPRPSSGLPDMWELLGHISCPTLVVRGAASAVLRRDVAERMTEVLPQGRLETVPRAGHAVMVDNPAAFNALVSAFLRRTLVPDGDARPALAREDPELP